MAATGFESTTTWFLKEHSIIWSVWFIRWVFVYELSSCEFESCCCHLIFRYRACLEQHVSWHSGKYRVKIHSEARTWHDNSTQWQRSLPMGQKFTNCRVLFLLQSTLNYKCSTKTSWLQHWLWEKRDFSAQKSGLAKIFVTDYRMYYIVMKKLHRKTA